MVEIGIWRSNGSLTAECGSLEQVGSGSGIPQMNNGPLIWDDIWEITCRWRPNAIDGLSIKCPFEKLGVIWCTGDEERTIFVCLHLSFRGRVEKKAADVLWRESTVDWGKSLAFRRDPRSQTIRVPGWNSQLFGGKLRNAGDVRSSERQVGYFWRSWRIKLNEAGYWMRGGAE